jgi:phage FluMu protein Com
VITVQCLAPFHGTACQQVLYKLGPDFTGTIESKCPRCRNLEQREYREGERVA